MKHLWAETLTRADFDKILHGTAVFEDGAITKSAGRADVGADVFQAIHAHTFRLGITELGGLPMF